MSAKTVTRLMIVLWCLQFPFVYFLPYSNCWYYAVKQWLKHGGDIIAVRSNLWSGHHFIYMSPQLELWEYTYPNMQKNTPWYKLLIYNGKIRRVKSKNS